MLIQFGKLLDNILEINRKISVAPMMDWTDEVKKCSQFNHLAPLEKACRLYVTSAQKRR